MHLFLVVLFVFLLNHNCFAAPSFHQKMDDVDIYVFSVGDFNPPAGNLIPNNKDDEKFIQNKIKKAPLNKQNILLLKHANFIALVDSGYSDTFPQLKKELNNLNIQPESITHVILTHAHFDHIGGMIFAGQKSFPNAKLYLDQKEYQYWEKENNPISKEAFSLYANEIFFFSEKENLLPAHLQITARPAYGHTPGHNLIQFKTQQNQSLVFWADLMHFYEVQKERPNIGIVFDVNPTQAIQTRLKFLKEFKEFKTPILGAHMPFGKPIVLE